MQTWVILARTVEQAKAHMMKIFNENPSRWKFVKNPYSLISECRDLRYIIATTPDKLRGLRNFQLYRCGDWFERDDIEGFEEMVRIDRLSRGE
jgi:hypothetical protein